MRRVRFERGKVGVRKKERICWSVTLRAILSFNCGCMDGSHVLVNVCCSSDKSLLL